MSVIGPIYTGHAEWGRMVSGADVEDWCIDLIRRWMDTYLAEVERDHQLAVRFYARPRSVIRTISFDAFPEDQVPRVMVVSTGIATPPIRRGDGQVDARWLMGLACVCSAATQDGSHVMARHYMAAIRSLFGQRSTLDGQADGTDWLDERYDDLAFDDTRSLSSGQAHFAIDVNNVDNFNLGPVSTDTPFVDAAPWPPWLDVTSADVEIENVPPDTDLSE